MIVRADASKPGRTETAGAPMRARRAGPWLHALRPDEQAPTACAGGRLQWLSSGGERFLGGELAPRAPQRQRHRFAGRPLLGGELLVGLAVERAGERGALPG